MEEQVLHVIKAGNTFNDYRQKYLYNLMVSHVNITGIAWKIEIRFLHALHVYFTCNSNKIDTVDSEQKKNFSLKMKVLIVEASRRTSFLNTAA